ncbi:hypothetical protein GTQ40_05155 [Flavobacteriaceae bacterium R38]|nr:hypothetical protein [Flavobacteriaceae bacterium R38]
MSSFETRQLLKSTYTPIKNEKKNPGYNDSLSQFTPSHPFLKMNGLIAAFKNKEIFEILRNQFQKKPPSGISQSDFKEALTGLQLYFEKGTVAASKHLQKLPIDVVQKISRNALSIRKKSLDKLNKEFTIPSSRTLISKTNTIKSDNITTKLLSFKGFNLNNVNPLFFKLRVIPNLFLDFNNDQAMVDNLSELAKIEPVGVLHLERITFEPVGYTKGELMYSVPLTPNETIRMTHREWTRTEREYESVTQTSIETAVEDALSEKSELSESFESQSKHDTSFNTSLSATGSYGPVSISASVGYNINTSESTSRRFSAKKVKELTKKASSRAKKDHKITFKVGTEKEVENTSYRELTNTTTDPVRWDFHRVMKEWRVSLYRYDVRLTYDLVLPEPGSYLLKDYIKIKLLKERLKEDIPFGLSINEITESNWQTLSNTYKVALNPPPPQTKRMTYGMEVNLRKDYFAFRHLEIKAPDDYYIDPENTQGISSGIITERRGRKIAFVDPFNVQNKNRLRNGGHADSFLWRFMIDADNEVDAKETDVLDFALDVTFRRKDAALLKWKAENYEILLRAYQEIQEKNRFEIENELEELEAKLVEIDPLILRKKEKEEIMKNVLRFLLGPDFSFYPENLSIIENNPDHEIGIYDRDSGSLKPGVTASWLKQGHIIRFLHHAIEWENVNYIMYPYFWSDTDRWELKSELQHFDFYHRSFLRAGACRVVLTIRPGFEESFLSFMETADTEEILESDHPYITLAEEMKNMAQERYPYTPGANDENPDNLVDQWFEYTPTGALDVELGETLDS